MDNRAKFSVAMAAALVEYKAAQADVLDAMRSGNVAGEAWGAKQLRLTIPLKNRERYLAAVSAKTTSTELTKAGHAGPYLPNLVWKK